MEHTNKDSTIGEYKGNRGEKDASKRVPSSTRRVVVSLADLNKVVQRTFSQRSSYGRPRLPGGVARGRPHTEDQLSHQRKQASRARSQSISCVLQRGYDNGGIVEYIRSSNQLWKQVRSIRTLLYQQTSALLLEAVSTCQKTSYAVRINIQYALHIDDYTRTASN
jgi:hypothetical protein